MNNTAQQNVLIELMYRDGGNWKNCDTFILNNKKNIQEKKIEEFINFLIEQEKFVPYYYGLPTIAPISNEFLPIDPNTIDHAFNECCSYEMTNSSVTIDIDISECIDLLKNEGWRERKRQERDNMVAQLEEQTSNLKALKLD